MSVSLTMWLVTVGAILVLVVMDFLTVSRKPHEVSFKEAALWSEIGDAPPCRVGGEHQVEPAPADVDVGVMVEFLGRLRDHDDPLDGSRERRRLDIAHERAALDLPRGQ